MPASFSLFPVWSASLSPLTFPPSPSISNSLSVCHHFLLFLSPLLSRSWIKQNRCLWKVPVMNVSSLWWGWGRACHKSCPRERGDAAAAAGGCGGGGGGEGGLYHDKYWEVEWAIVLSQCGGAHFPPPPSLWNVALWLGPGRGAEQSREAVIQEAIAEDAFWSRMRLWYKKASDKLLSEWQIFSFFARSARLVRHVIEREHANKANDFPPTLHFSPRGSCLSSHAHTSFTKYSSVSSDPPHPHTRTHSHTILYTMRQGALKCLIFPDKNRSRCLLCSWSHSVWDLFCSGWV